jgi:hypothetical protein
LIRRLLAVVEARAATGQTGAVWQRRILAALDPSQVASKRWRRCWTGTWSTS